MEVTNTVLKWLSKQGTIVSFKIPLDKLYLLDRLVEKGQFKSRTQAILTAIDELLSQYYPEHYTEKLVKPVLIDADSDAEVIQEVEG